MSRLTKKHTLRYVPDDQLIQDRKTMTLREIGLKYDCTPSTVSHRLKQLGMTGNRPRYDELIPWRVSMEHDGASELACLRLLGQYRNGRALNRYDLGALQRFIHHCLTESVVIDYQSDVGFMFVPSDNRTIEGHPYYEEALAKGVHTAELSA